MAQAEWILARCQEFHCLPSQLMAEDAQLLQMMAIVRAGAREGVPNDE